jgi:nucleotide-binding universal stress UspA family protein
MKILVAVDGSKPSLKAVQLLIDHCDWYRQPPEVELLAVHLPVPQVGHLNKAQLERYYKHARDKRCELIYIGTRGMSALGKALVGSTATKVLHISDVPVLLVK